jgi:putative tryptophan/tyrosine transport system substrate-binding protein
MSVIIGRRELIAALGGAAAGWPLAARAQQARVPMIGFLGGQSPKAFAHLLAAFHRGLNETGYVEGRNVTIEYRWAEGQMDRLPALAADLVRRRVDVIAATGGNVSAFAAKAATTTIPVVFNSNDDPVKLGLVASLNRPGGNLTGVSWFNSETITKKVELLHQVVPAGAIALLVDPSDPESAPQLGPAQDAARTLGRQLVVLEGGTASGIDAAFVSLVQQRMAALVVASGASFLSRGDQIIGLAGQHAIAAIFSGREFTTAGGLMSYGNVLADAYRRNGIYVGRILKGDKPGDLPIDRSTKFELVINLKTAKALGREIPPNVLALADEVIE